MKMEEDEGNGPPLSDILLYIVLNDRGVFN